MPDGLALPLLPDAVRRPARTPATIDPRLRWHIAVAVAAGHLALLLLVDAALRPRLPLRPPAAPGLTIRWIDIVLPEASPAPRADPTSVERASDGRRPVEATVDAARAAAAPDRATATGASAATATPDTRRLFGPDGRPSLSREVVDASGAKAKPDFAPPTREELPPILSPLPYRETRFDKDWAPDGETLGEELVRKLSRETEVRTPWGTRWRCKVVIVGVACGDVPPAPMKNRPKMPWETYIEEPEPVRPLD